MIKPSSFVNAYIQPGGHNACRMSKLKKVHCVATLENGIKKGKELSIPTKLNV